EGHHGDAAVHGADNRAEIAAHAVGLAHLRDRFAGDAARAEAMAVRRHQINALVGAVLAGDVAKVAADALVVIDPGDALVIEIQRLPLLDGRHGFTHEI